MPVECRLASRNVAKLPPVCRLPKPRVGRMSGVQPKTNREGSRKNTLTSGPLREYSRINHGGETMVKFVTCRASGSDHRTAAHFSRRMPPGRTIATTSTELGRAFQSGGVAALVDGDRRKPEVSQAVQSPNQE